MVVRSKLDVLIRMADLKVRNVATCAGRYAQVGRQDGEEGIVTLFTWGRLPFKQGFMLERGKEKGAMAAFPWDLRGWRGSMLSWH